MSSRPIRRGRRFPAASKAERFLLTLIRSGDAAYVTTAGNLRLRGERLSLSRAAADDLVARDLATWSSDGGLVPTDAGRAWAIRQDNPQDPYLAQHAELVPDRAGRTVNVAESPLLWLYRRKDANGNRLIGDAMFAAGERLRADFTFGNMSPRVTLNWTAAIQGSRNPQGAEPADSALAARQRARRALDRVGPELSGILIDVCCFLKKLEDVERDRRWPPRSAKVILALALRRLARHYGYSDSAEGRALRKTA